MPPREHRRPRGLLFIALASLVAAQSPPTSVTERIVEQRLSLADLRNHWYTIGFPKPREQTRYGGKSEYLYSIISPNGRSLFACRREFDSRGIPLDTLVRRELQASGPREEEIVPIPFTNLFQFAVSPNESFMVIAGRLQDPSVPRDKRDGIFVLNRKTGGLHPIAPYASLSQDIRSFNVSDDGDRVIYEDNGSVMIFSGPGGQTVSKDHHPGKLPALMPDGRGYVYLGGSELILNDGQTKRQLLSVSNVVGAIRVSPEAQFIAFGVDLFGDLSLSQLRICEVKTLACVDGPKYTDWIAGRETFWIKE